MSRQSLLLAAVTVGAMICLTGCHPKQPCYLMEDGDLSHYLDVATDINYPDVEEYTLPDAEGAMRPFSLDNTDPNSITTWDLSLEETIQLALANGKVLRSIGGQIQGPPEALTRAAFSGSLDQILTVYDPALVETNPRFGTEAALSAFDAQLSTSVFWEKNDAPRNPLVFPGSTDVFPRVAKEDVGSFQAQLRKTAATGGTWLMTHNVNYSKQNTSRLFTSDWNVNLEAEFRQPLLQGAGVQYNRIAGPGAIPGFNNGVTIARINSDVALADFESGVEDFVSDVETAYWEVYYAYRQLDAVIAGRDSGLQTWKQAYIQLQFGSKAAHEEAQARQQYFLFKVAMQQSLSSLYAAESKLRYMMGLASTDGRLIRPSDEPPVGKVTFDWEESLCEALVRNVDLRRQKWNIKRRELELISAKNWLLPRLDAVARYRWNGLGDDLSNLNNRTGDPFNNAYENLTLGNYQEWHFGLDLTIPIGFRKEMSGVRYAQLNLARDRARLQDEELEVSHQLAYAIREAEDKLTIAQTNFDRRIAAQDEVNTAQAKYEAGVADGTLDRVLDAQRRQAEAESDYYRALVDYVKAIRDVHLRKGSLLEYNGVHLTEGPWTGKAYFDAMRRARARDSSMYLDYGFTRPKVVSRGAYQQHVRSAGEAIFFDDEIQDGNLQAPLPEIIPTPAPVPPQDDDALAPPGAEQIPPGLRIDPPTVGAKTGKPLTGGSSSSAVKKAGHEQTAWRAGKSTSKRTEAKRTEAKRTEAKRAEAKQPKQKWLSTSGALTSHESDATSTLPAAGADRSASGWKGLQR